MVIRARCADGVRGVFPTVTYPSHTTLITGAMPARHGIYYNSPFEPGGQTGRWYWEADAIRVPTLWDAVREAGTRNDVADRLQLNAGSNDSPSRLSRELNIGKCM